MRGLLQAALALAPALASSAAVRADHGLEIDTGRVDGIVDDHSFALINVDAKGSRSPDNWNSKALSFRLDILPSVEACGSGNVTLDGQVLPQTEENGLWSGQGSVSMDRKSIVVASWSFQCIKAQEVPELQLMTFKVDFVDGKPLDDAGFTVLFQQAGTPKIISIETSLSIPEEVKRPDAERPHFPHGPSPDEEDGAFPPPPHHGHEENYGHEAHGHEPGHKGFPPHNFDDDMAELHWMRSQLLELEWMIFEKEQAMALYASESQDEDIRKCDSLKCVIKTAVEKARGAVHHAVGKIVGDNEFEEGFHGHHFPHPPPSRRPYFGPKFPKGKESFKHGNETHGHPKGNSTHPHRPHSHKRPLPVCRFPPPPPHRFGPPPHPHHAPGQGPYPGPPPPFDSHHRPHPHGGPPGPSFPHGEHGKPAEGPHGPHSPPELSPEERRPFGEDGRPHHDERPHQGHGGSPPFHGEEHERPGHMEEGHKHPGPKNNGPDRHDGPPPPPFNLVEGFESPSPSEEDRKPNHEGPQSQEHDSPAHMGRPPPPEHGPEHEGEGKPEFNDPEHRGKHGGPDHGPEHGPDHGPPPPPRHHKPKLSFALHVFKWTVVGFLAAILLAALHKRTCTPSKRAARQARREKRELRRAYRRAVHKNAIMKLMTRITGNGEDSDDGEEKDMYEHQRLIGDAENGNSTTMAEEITQFQNAAAIVSDIVAATPQSSATAPVISQHDITHSAPSERAQLFSDDLYSEELPAYEDNDGSEMSSVVADGFRYTPGSSDYSPSHSSSGSVSDILGPDTKQ